LDATEHHKVAELRPPRKRFHHPFRPFTGRHQQPLHPTKTTVIFVTKSLFIRRYDDQPNGPSTLETAIPPRSPPVSGTKCLRGGCFMTGFVPVMWMVWVALVLIMLALKMYTDRLGRDEDDQLILADSFQHVKIEQAAMMAKINKFAPIRKVVLVLVGAMTLFVIGYYALDVINQFK
jgi:hypothetical protein